MSSCRAVLRSVRTARLHWLDGRHRADLVARLVARALRAAAARLARRGRARGRARAAAALPPLVFAGEARDAARRARRGRRGARVPAPGRRLRRVVPRLLGDRDPREAEDPAADGGRAHLRRGAAGREGRPDRRASSRSRARRRPSASDGVEMPLFRGHMVHDDEPTAAGARPDPERMLQGYYQAAATLNLLRAFTKGGFADLTQVHTWNQDSSRASPEGQRYEQIAAEIERALASWRRAGSTSAPSRSCTRSTSGRATRACCSTTRSR